MDRNSAQTHISIPTTVCRFRSTVYSAHGNNGRYTLRHTYVTGKSLPRGIKSSLRHNEPHSKKQVGRWQEG